MKFLSVFLFVLFLVFSTAPCALAQSEAPVQLTYEEDDLLSAPDKTDALLDAFGDALVDTLDARGQSVGEAFDKRSDREKALSDIPEAYIDEAELYGLACQNDAKLRQFHNCECMKVRFLDARIAHGAEASRTFLSNQLLGSCKDGTYLAGSTYDSCLAYPTRIGEAPDFEAYCGCMGKRVAERYERSRGAITSSRLSDIRISASFDCRNARWYQ